VYTSDLPVLESSNVTTFADYTAILGIGSSNEESTEKLQTTINQIQKWTKKWNIQLNQSKSFHINFTNRYFEHIPITINPLKPELNPICYLLALLVHHFLHVSRIRVKSLTFRRLMSYIYMEHPFLMFLDHTQRRSTVGRTPLDE